MSDDLVKKWRALQEKVRRYEQLSKSTTTKRPAKQKTYEKEWKQAVADLARLEKKIMIEGRKLHRQRQLEAKQLEEAKAEVAKNKKIKKEVKKEVEKNEKKIVQRKRQPKGELSHIYCGAQKPGKGKRVGTEAECRKKGQIRMYGKKQIADLTGGNVNKLLGNEILDASVKKREEKLHLHSQTPTNQHHSKSSKFVR